MLELLSALVGLNTYGATPNLSRSTRFYCSSRPDVGCKGFRPPRVLKSGENLILLENGDEAFHFRVDSIKKAKKSIRIQTFIWRNDEAGRIIANLLKEKKKEGVEVTVILDNVGNINPEARLLYADMARAGIEILGINTKGELVLNQFFSKIPGKIFSRHHTKLWLVDAGTENAMGIIGGRNIANEYFRIGDLNLLEDIKRTWTDMDVALHGEIVNDMNKLFEANRNYFRTIIEEGFSTNGLDIWNLPYALPSYELPSFVKDYGNLPNYPETKKQKIAENFLTVTPYYFKTDDAVIRLFQSRPTIAENYIEQAYFHLINNAKKEIHIVNSYLIPTENLTVALRNAARRGVKVKIITNGLESSDLGFVVQVSRYYYNDLLSLNYDPLVISNSGQIAIYEWIGPSVKEGTIHSKWACADQNECIIGSYNLNQRSYYFDTEAVVAIESPTLGKEMHKIFYEWHLAIDKKKRKYLRAKFIDPVHAEKYFRRPPAEELSVQIQRLLEKNM